jgi:signal transduction histidine kinase
VKGRAVGTIWAIHHEDLPERRKFDTEDLRLLESLGRFASAAYQTVESQGELEQQTEALRQSHAQLEASYKHLDAFTYSVSHDLPAPLRAVNAYSDMLIEDYAGKVLDETAPELCPRSGPVRPANG